MCLSGCCGRYGGLTVDAIKRISDSIKTPGEQKEIAPSASHEEEELN